MMDKLLLPQYNKLVAHSGGLKYLFNSEFDALKWTANILELEQGFKVSYPEQLDNSMWRVFAGRTQDFLERI